MRPSRAKSEGTKGDGVAGSSERPHTPEDDMAMEYVSFPSSSVPAQQNRSVTPQPGFKPPSRDPAKRASLPPASTPSELGVIPHATENLQRSPRRPAPLPHIGGNVSPQPLRRPPAASTGLGSDAVSLARSGGAPGLSASAGGSSPLNASDNVQQFEYAAFPAPASREDNDLMLQSMADFGRLPAIRRSIEAARERAAATETPPPPPPPPPQPSASPSFARQRQRPEGASEAAPEPDRASEPDRAASEAPTPPPSTKTEAELLSSLATEVDEDEAVQASARLALGASDQRRASVVGDDKSIPMQEMDRGQRGKELADSDYTEPTPPPSPKRPAAGLSAGPADAPPGTVEPPAVTKAEPADDSTSEHGAKERLPGLKARLKRKHKWKAYPAVYVNDQDTNADKGFPTNRQRTTKYTPWTFLPQNLFEQFRRATNVYFLAITIVTCVPQVSPFTPYTTVAALVFVLLVAAIKEAYEDIKRYQQDKAFNELVYEVVPHDGGKPTEVQCQHLKVGQVLMLRKDQSVPADCVLLWSKHEEEGLCYVDTAQLDGETSLKELRALHETYFVNEEGVPGLRARIRLEVPHSDLYTFRANLEVLESAGGAGHAQKHPLDKKQLLLRGARIRNTPYVYAVIVYAGKDTKLALNQKNPPHKFSQTERFMNNIVLALVIFQVACMIVCGVGAAILQAQSGGGRRWYLFSLDTEDAGLSFVYAFFSYFVLLSYVVPMSMMVSLEIIKVVQGIVIGWDESMRLDPNDKTTGASARNSNLNDELGRVKYIFSDKTGTLTENKMIFSKASICSRQFDDPINGELGTFLKDNNWDPAKAWTYGDLTTQVGEYLRALAVCHAAVIEKDDATTDSRYQASSPDEIALCNAARVNQFVFTARKAGTMTVTEFGVERIYKVLNTMEFSSDRRRMSVIIRTPEGEIRMYTKGADSVMWGRLAEVPEQAAERKAAGDQISEFSKQGLRTLIVGSKVLSDDEFATFNRAFLDASGAVTNREQQVEEVCDKMERGLRLVGATAVEDRLQDGVPETLAYLLKAGIKIWMITGDKQETAINIGHSSRLLSSEQLLVVVDGLKPDEVRKQIDDGNAAKPTENIGLVINGISMPYCLTDNENNFVKLCFRATSVVVCRATPLQKAQIVDLVKKNDKRAITLAIGDGANDVSMIQAGHIGVGIFGKEGTQAARASDYAMQQFSHLRRLLTIHGRYSLVRNSGLIQMSLYKNIAFFYALFWFSFYNAFSGQSIIDDWIVTVFNIIIAALPPLFYAVFEKDVNERVVEQNPELYIEIAHPRRVFSYITMAMWLASALFHSIVLWWAAVLLMDNDAIFTDGQVAGLWGVAGVYATAGLCVTFGKMYLEHSLWNWGTVLGLLLSLLAYFMLLLTISSMPNLWPQSLGVIYEIFATPVFYLYCLAVFGVCLVPELTVKYWLRQYYPTRWQIMQEKDRMSRSAAAKAKQKLDAP